MRESVAEDYKKSPIAVLIILKIPARDPHHSIRTSQRRKQGNTGKKATRGGSSVLPDQVQDISIKR
jgi:hypothetical protein